MFKFRQFSTYADRLVQKKHIQWSLYGAAGFGTLLTSFHFKSVQLQQQSEVLNDLHHEEQQQSKYFKKILDQFNNQDHSIAYQSNSLGQLITSYLVFKACQIELLVSSSQTLLTMAKSVGLSSLSNWIVKRTFFAQFCGGENASEVVPVMTALKSNGISSILDLSMESDLTEATDMTVYPDGKTASDLRAERVVQLIKECIDAASSVNSDNFVAIKVTALGSTNSLLNISGALNYIWDGFNFLDSDQDGTITRKQLEALVQQYPGYDPKINSEFFMNNFFDRDQEQFQWNDLMHVINLETVPRLFYGEIPLAEWCLNRQSSSSPKFRVNASEYDLKELHKIESRLDELCRWAEEKNVRLMIDAEQSYFQCAIDYLALKMMRKYNHPLKENARVYNTYQMYLKDGLKRLMNDLALSDMGDDGGFLFAVKLVRGAYMQSEDSRARVLNLKYPINDSKQVTDQYYDQAVELLLRKNMQDANDKSNTIQKSVSLVVASHNRMSVLKCCAIMEELGVQKDKGIVYFGQLLGMHDHLSYSLAANGYQVGKYIPYGPIEDVIPYLIRRAQENKAVFGSVSNKSTGLGAQGLDDMSLLYEAIQNRLFQQKDGQRKQ
ncbi:hypothetical protein MIR68_007558 [Amoeboaphelidium protococcarum]|nr:hypothetical protein MIR68_007558 [Amoeboaphelidium protococcarum]